MRIFLFGCEQQRQHLAARFTYDYVRLLRNEVGKPVQSDQNQVTRKVILHFSVVFLRVFHVSAQGCAYFFKHFYEKRSLLLQLVGRRSLRSICYIRRLRRKFLFICCFLFRLFMLLLLVNLLLLFFLSILLRFLLLFRLFLIIESSCILLSVLVLILLCLFLRIKIVLLIMRTGEKQ